MAKSKTQSSRAQLDSLIRTQNQKRTAFLRASGALKHKASVLKRGLTKLHKERDRNFTVS